MTRPPQTEIAVLGALSTGPMSGYEVRRSITEVLGHFWHESYGQIYPSLAALERAGSVRRTGPGRTSGTVFEITATGEQRLRDYFIRHIAIAKARNAGFVLESASWRASPDWGAKLGLTSAELTALNRSSIALLVALRAEHETPQCPMPISGNIGPRGDGYVADQMMSGDEAMRYHAYQCDLFADSEAGRFWSSCGYII